MSISYNTLSDEDYASLAYMVPHETEGDGQSPNYDQAYMDTAGNPTIGVGINLTVLPNFDSILATFGIIPDNPAQGLSAYDIATDNTYYTELLNVVTTYNGSTSGLQSALNAIMAARAANTGYSATYQALYSPASRSYFGFLNSTEDEDAFNNTLSTRDNQLTTDLAAVGLTIPNSDERVALLSMFYNAQNRVRVDFPANGR